MSTIGQKNYDTHTLYVNSGVAKENQLLNVLENFVSEANILLGYNTNCKVSVNLIVSKLGEYFGFGYIFVSSEEIYWMLLGKNPDGSERVEEYPDPNWTPPKQKIENKDIENKNWYDIVIEEDALIQPMIKKELPPLIELSGYEYDEEQFKHLKEISSNEGKGTESIPKNGYFEISRAYAKDVERKKMYNVLCTRSVPEWIPLMVFKRIFDEYSISKNEKYPIIKIINGKKSSKGKIVFATFDPKTKNALFALLMTRKVRIKHPNNPKLKATLIFDHAYDHQRFK